MDNCFVDESYLARCSEKTLQTNEKGFFLQFADQVAELAGNEWIKNVFGKLQTDAERIRIIYEYKPVKDALCDTLVNVQELYRKKNAEVSQRRRVECEKLMVLKEYEKALVLGSQSVLRAPPTGVNPTVDDGLSLALALWTRSNVLIILNKYVWAIKDLQASNKEGLFEQVKPEFYCRMAICYKGLGDSKKSDISLSVASKMANNDPKILKRIEDIKNTSNLQQIESNRRYLPNVETHTHTDLPDASKKIGVKEEKGKGKHVIAKEQIYTGEILVVQQPYACCLLPDCFSTHCHHCFDRLVSPVGCPDCANVAFCTLECRDKAILSYHKYECRYLDLLIGSGMSILCHTALRMITQNSLKNSIKLYQHKEKSNIFHLCTNAHLRMSSDFFQRTIMAAFLLRCLQKSGFFEDREDNENIIPNEDELVIGEMLLFNLQMLQFNSHEIYETRHKPEHRLKTGKSVYIGLAIYPTVALFNHDCHPAVTRHFVGKHIVITASRPLSPGETVGENYGPIFTRRSLIERQKCLSSRYWFQCKCQACCQDWLSFDKGLESCRPRLKCTNNQCSNFFTLPLSKEVITCPRCNKSISLRRNISQLKTVEKQYEEVFNLVDNQEPERAIALMCEAIDTFYKISSPPHYMTHLAQEALRACLADSGNTYCCLPK